MATTIKTVMTYPLDGSTTDFNIPFEYLARKFVRVTLIGVDRKELILNQDYRFATKTTISTTRALGPADGYNLIEIRRYTSATERLVDFTDGSILRAYDLNISQVQTLHVAEEARDLTADTIGVNNDGDLDARGRRIVNVADAKDPGDAINLGQVQKWNDSALNSANRARAEADRATVRASEAATSAGNSASSASLSRDWAIKESPVEGTFKSSRSYALDSMTYRDASKSSAAASAVSASAAQTSEINANNSKIAAKTSETNAKTSETNAKASEERAIEEANKLGNFNGLAGAVDRVDGTSVYWKGAIHTNGRLYLTTDGFECGQYQQFFGNVPNRYSVMEWGDKDGWHLYSERKTEGGRPTLNVNGDVSVGFDIRAGASQFANHMFVHDREQHWPGAGMFANQFYIKEAPFIKQGKYEAPNGNALYAPIVKGIIRTAYHGYDTAVSFGALTHGNGSFASAVIHVIGDNGADGVWEFNPNDKSFRSQGDGFFGSTTVYRDGNIGGPLWGGDLAHWLRVNTVNHIAMGGVNQSTVWRSNGVSDGGGKVVTGVVNANANDLIDYCEWRVMQYVRNDGQRFNIY